jgi:anaerobic ribonucleoside-triphosphate reductase activating protein
MRAARGCAAAVSAPGRCEGTRPPELQVGGLVPFTVTDYPGRLAAVVFVQGCPWRCRYCHNPHLQARRGAAGPPWEGVLAWLRGREGLLDAVVFSGGEPTADPALPRAMREVRALGLAVGLHSAGMLPRRLAAALPLVDWVGLDVKAPLDDAELHDAVAGVPRGAARVREAVQQVLASGVAHEFRTTAHPLLLDDEAVLRIGRSLAAAGARSFALQVARPVEGDAASLPAVGAGYPAASTVRALEGLFPCFTLRRG